MTKMTLVISLFLTWAAFDSRLFRGRRESYSLGAIEISLEEADEQIKKVQRRRSSVIPPWLRKKKRVYRSKLNYFSTKSRDHRDSDQRKIRRKINNL